MTYRPRRKSTGKHASNEHSILCEHPHLDRESVSHNIPSVSAKEWAGWPEELFRGLRHTGEIFVNALQRKQAEEASRENERMLRQNESELRELAGRLITPRRRKRSPLSRELHDDLAQRLAVVAIDVGRLELTVDGSTGPVR